MKRNKPQKCAVCSGVKHHQILKIEELVLWLCQGCGLYVLCSMNIDDSKKDYSSVLDINAYISYMRPFRVGQYREELKSIDRLAKGKTLLDVGCAAGWFLSEAREWGYQPIGIEPQRSLAAIARRENERGSVFCNDIDSLNVLNKKFDVVTLWSVLEHCRDLTKAIRSISSAIVSGGVLAIRTPNSRGLLQQLSILLYKISAGRLSFPLRLILQMEFASKHWFLFNRDNLSQFLVKAGYRVSEVRCSTSIDWRHLDLWYRARRRDRGVLFWVLVFALAVHEVVASVLQARDDLVIMAVKI